MAREHNFLLGQGERIAAKVKVPKASGDKNPPYDFSTARARISTRLLTAQNEIAKLPEDACPGGEAVAVVTMHPRYLSKSDFPADLLASVGLRAVGSRARTVTPERWGVEKHGETALTEDLFVAGTRTSFKEWSRNISQWTERTPGANVLSHIEDLAAVVAKTKLKAIPQSAEKVLLEVVLHNAGSDEITRAFFKFAEARGAEPLKSRIRVIQGLTFVPVRVDPERSEDLARFAFLRVARGMPAMRPFRPAVLRSATSFSVELPAGSPPASLSRAAIFDGGIPKSALAALQPWVSLVEPTGIGKPVSALEEHGLGVTTAFLFGSLSAVTKPTLPICPVDHIRVLDERTGDAGDIEYFDVLDRITKHLEANPGKYSLVNISLGPSMAVDDDDITLWTAELDKRFAHGRYVVTVAAGNDGELDEASGLNRIQPPADGVNVISVGAADSLAANWQRATYSCIGPGRSPGIVKPDGVVFGGSQAEQFGVLTPKLSGGFVTGTSFAAPLALRSAAAVRVQLGDGLGPLAVRALLIHRAVNHSHLKASHVGWGRFETDPTLLVTCDDDEALVVFQGELPVGEHLRAPVPMPATPLVGEIRISATLLISPEVDPEHPATYTRSGLEAAFRPHSRKFTERKDGSRPLHAKTRAFFSQQSLYGKGEAVQRDDGHKWEPCRRSHLALRAASLHEPCFDIYYHHRENGTKASNPQPIPYAFIVGLKALQVPDLYDRIVRAYANVLVPIQPQIRIPVRV